MKSSLKVILAYGLAIAVMIGVIALVYRSTTSGTEPLTDGDFINDLVNGEVATFNLDYNKNRLIYWVFVKDENGIPLDENGKPVATLTQQKDENGEAVLDENGEPVYEYVYHITEDTKLKLVEKKIDKLANIELTHEQAALIAQQQVEGGYGVGLLHSFEFTPQTEIPWWVSLLPGLIVVIALILLYYFAMKKMMNSGGPGGAKMAGFGKAHVKLPDDDKNKVR